MIRQHSTTPAILALLYALVNLHLYEAAAVNDSGWLLEAQLTALDASPKLSSMQHI